MRQPHPHLRRQRHRALTALFVGIALLTASCSNNNDGDTDDAAPVTEAATPTTETPTTAAPPTTTTTSTEPASTTRLEDIERPEIDLDQEWETISERIIGRYLLYQEAFEAAAGPPGADPDYQPLQDLAAVELLEDVRSALVARRDRGQTDVLSEKSRHVLRFADQSGVFTEVEGVRVVIQDCFVRVGESVNGGESEKFAETLLGNGRLIFDGGEWIVHALSFNTEESDGYDECQAFGRCVLEEEGGDECELWSETAA